MKKSKTKIIQMSTFVRRYIATEADILECIANHQFEMELF